MNFYDDGLFIHYSLVDKLVEYIEQNRLLRIPRIEDDFPKTITLGQAVGVWKYIVVNVCT